MIVKTLNEDYVKLYSRGIEKRYGGNYIEYENSSVTFLFFYYRKLTRLYIVNGMYENQKLVQVNEKINKICMLENKEARRMRKFIDEKEKTDNLIFKMPPLFFRECKCFIGEKNYYNRLNNLFNRYKEKMENGITYPYN